MDKQEFRNRVRADVVAPPHSYITFTFVDGLYFASVGDVHYIGGEDQETIKTYRGGTYAGNI